ncbi:hypothetical protein [Sabulicella glaciei]|nr:hypothetical protein [Roseococcus sp. MDT2-1-1]
MLMIVEGSAWRAVEVQAQGSTMKLFGTMAEQDILVRELDRSKPPTPPECGHCMGSWQFPSGTRPFRVAAAFVAPGSARVACTQPKMSAP